MLYYWDITDRLHEPDQESSQCPKHLQANVSRNPNDEQLARIRLESVRGNDNS